jgi:hypothetical protein
MAVYWTLVQWRHRFQVSGFFGMCDPGCGIQDMSNLASQTFLIRILFHRAKPILSGVEGTPSTQRSSSLTHFLSPFLPSPFSLVRLLGCRVVLACLPDTRTLDTRPSTLFPSYLVPSPSTTYTKAISSTSARTELRSRNADAMAAFAVSPCEDESRVVKREG